MWQAALSYSLAESQQCSGVANMGLRCPICGGDMMHCKSSARCLRCGYQHCDACELVFLPDDSTPDTKLLLSLPTNRNDR